MSKGGARQGAGRKPVDPHEKKVSVTFSVPRYILKTAQVLRAAGCPLNEIIEGAIRDACFAYYGPEAEQTKNFLNFRKFD